MAERPVPEAIARLDLASIADVGARQAIRALLNLVEELAAENRALRTELAQVKDELARLKGGSGRPKIPPGQAGGGDYSSEQGQRPGPKTWRNCTPTLGCRQGRGMGPGSVNLLGRWARRSWLV